jgi:tetratricopeptide (TPR) repeat protein
MAGKQLIDADFGSARSARAIALLWLLIVAGCSGIQPAVEVESATPDDAATATQPASTPAVDTPDTSNATLALLQQSQRAATSGATNEAIAYLERAIRIEPRRADLWLQLAALEVTNQQHRTAIAYANKALTLAGNRADWQRDAWLIIADAKAAQGDLEAASQIRQRWRSYRG